MELNARVRGRARVRACARKGDGATGHVFSGLRGVCVEADRVGV